MRSQDKPRKTWSARYPFILSLISLLMLGGLIGGWAARAEIKGAVIGSGTVEVAQTMTALQHPVGGVVAEILAIDGDHVAAGDVVVRLDDAQLRSDLKITEGSLFEVLANIARLEAEIDGSRDISWPPLLVSAAAENSEYRVLMDRQARQLADHYASLDTEARLLDEQIRQVSAQIEALQAQLSAKQEEWRFVQEEKTRLDTLQERGLLKATDRFSNEKSRVSVTGDIGKLEANIAELRGKITEIDLKRHTLGPKERDLAVTELSRLRPDRTKYYERRASLRERLASLEIRAPISGRIHDSKVMGVRSVVVAAKPLMMIVPDAEAPLINVRVSSTDIDQVYVGQEATLKFRAFSGRHTPLIVGDVLQISPDAFMDQRTRRTYYEVMLELRAGEEIKLGDRQLIAGMPVEAFMSTESRTPLNYVLTPFINYIDRAFRDT